MVSMATHHAIQQNGERVFGNSNEQFSTHEKLSLTSTIHVNCIKHDPIDLIYNFMLSQPLQIRIYIVSIWCMTSFTIRLASNKCPYAYNFRLLFAGNISLTGGIVIQHIKLHPGQFVVL